MSLNNNQNKHLKKKTSPQKYSYLSNEKNSYHRYFLKKSRFDHFYFSLTIIFVKSDHLKEKYIYLNRKSEYSSSQKKPILMLYNDQHLFNCCCLINFVNHTRLSSLTVPDIPKYSVRVVLWLTFRAGKSLSKSSNSNRVITFTFGQIPLKKVLIPLSHNQLCVK